MLGSYAREQKVIDLNLIKMGSQHRRGKRMV